MKHAKQIRYDGGPGLLSGNYTVCSTWKNKFSDKDSFAESNEKVDCERCLKRIKCRHSWRHIYTGRYGSEKGVHNYKCKKCHLTLEIYLGYKGSLRACIEEVIIPEITDKVCQEQLDKIIWTGFKSI